MMTCTCPGVRLGAVEFGAEKVSAGNIQSITEESRFKDASSESRICVQLCPKGPGWPSVKKCLARETSIKTIFVAREWVAWRHAAAIAEAKSSLIQPLRQPTRRRRTVRSGRW